MIVLLLVFFLWPWVFLEVAAFFFLLFGLFPFKGLSLMGIVELLLRAGVSEIDLQRYLFVVDYKVVLSQLGLVGEGQIHALDVVLAAHVVLLTVVVSEFVYVTVHREFDQACMWIAFLLPQLFAHVTKVVFLAVVLCKAINAIEGSVWAVLAELVLCISMLFQPLALEQSLLEQKHWFFLNTELAELQIVP